MSDDYGPFCSSCERRYERHGHAPDCRVAELEAENKRLRERVDELLVANNEALERRRAAEAKCDAMTSALDVLIEHNQRLINEKAGLSEQADSLTRWSNAIAELEYRVADWVRTRIGPDHMNRRERAMRLLEEAIELAQAEGITTDQVAAQAAHVFARPAGEPEQEAAGVAVTLLGWCAATGNRMLDLAQAEIERIEAKPIEQIRGSLARKADADLVVCVEDSTEMKGAEA